MLGEIIEFFIIKQIKKPRLNRAQSRLLYLLNRGLDIYSLNRTRYIVCTRDTPEGIL